MLIIQGKSGKILEINKEIKEYNNVLLVTTSLISDNNLQCIDKDISILRFKDCSEMWKEFKDRKFYKEFIKQAKEFDIVVFYIIEKQLFTYFDVYKKIEDKLGKEIIVTLQTENDNISFSRIS